MNKAKPDLSILDLPVKPRERKFRRAKLHELLDVMAADDLLRGLLRYDEMLRRAVVCGERPWEVAPSRYWTDSDSTNLRIYFERQYHLMATNEAAASALHAYAEMNRFHPLRNYLSSLAWDGVQRIATWLVRYCGARDTPYVREAGRCFLVGAVARIFQPGCKLDTCMLLEGRQGIGKSRSIRMLAGDYYSDAMPNLDDARTIGETTEGVWILEHSELAGLRKHEADTVKAFLSRSEDSYRPAYGRESLVVPRQFVMVGTCNPDAEGTYLRDPTGGRRFWPVAVTACDVAALAEDRDQLWAEAVAAFWAGQHWWFEDAATVAQAEREVADRTQENPWLDRTARYLDANPQAFAVKSGDVFEIAMGRPATGRDAAELRLIASALRDFGRVKKQTERGKEWRLPKNEPTEPSG
ncbi:hypothetical protein R69619_03735 [Paraburkholderia nemoris]|uniref:virulence-associated E family protein n=1 Tax=Paraburkholderia nemoris TaxID=2793076 RepID=UPI00190D512D|nr:virulence-associated E family protein [Paraburkholderia nemoris]MBK3743148.1 hypothetical protein [Paraburkholderia aspalathi]CAE6768599.1 hypothetical protein R69619_03735 [Paraburkholderia nemoris]